MDHTVVILAGALLLAVVVGLLTGMFGVGGGFLLTPALMILLHVRPATAVCTGLAVILVTSAVSLFHRRGTGTVDLRLGLLCGTGTMAGAFVGQRLLRRLEALPPVRIGGHLCNALEVALLWGFLALLAGIAALLFYDHRRAATHPHARPAVPLMARLRLPPRRAYPSCPQGPLSLPALLALGAGIGLLTGLMGIGGGVLWLPALFYFVGQRTASAAGTSLVIVLMACLLATALNATAGNVDPRLAAAMLAGGLGGTRYGTKLGLRLAGARLKFYFIFVVLVAMVMIAARLAALMFGRAPGG